MGKCKWWELVQMKRAVYRVMVSGRFQLIAPDNTAVLITRTMVQALIALLVTESQMTRTRAWLQDKLWSDVPSDKSANNLRQTLHQMRLCFGEDADIVSSSRTTISLDPERLHVSCDATKGEFLEGLDVRAQEFEHWLLQERLRRSGHATMQNIAPSSASRPQAHARPARRGLAIECANDPYSRLGQFELSFADAVRKSIREVIDFEPVNLREVSERSRDSISLKIHAHHGMQGRAVIRLAAYQGSDTGSYWADKAHSEFPDVTQPLPAEFLNLSCRACAVLTSKLCNARSDTGIGHDANYYAGAAIQQMYSMLPGSVDEATTLIRKAEETQSRGLFYALRAQLAVINFVESGGVNRAELGEAADEYCTKAMISEGTNSIVLSAVAHARLVFNNDLDAAAELSKLAVLSNAGNPMAWSTWANILLNTGKLEEASKAARMGLRLSKDTFFRYWTEFQYATTAVALNKTKEAIVHAERARALNPRYRPAMRYLIGLYANAENFEAARSTMTRLQKQEVDTNTDRFIHDDKYPVSMMRSAGLIDPAKLSEIT